MIGEEKTKFVDYFKYCTLCEYYDLPEYADPCHACLSEPVNYDSHKPTHYKSIVSEREEKAIMKDLSRLKYGVSR